MQKSSKSWSEFQPPEGYLSSFKSRSRLSHLLLQNQVLTLEGDRQLSLLDVGCGAGNLYRGRTRDFGRKFSRLVAIDLSRELLLQAKKLVPDLEIFYGDASALCRMFEASGQKFTGATMSHVFEMLEDPSELLASLLKLTDQLVIEFFLNPNTNLSGTVKGYERFPESQGGEEYFRAHYSRDDYHNVFSSIRLEARDRTYTVVKLVSPLLEG